MNDMFSEHYLDNSLIFKILKIIKKYQGPDISDGHLTENGFQTRNLLPMFNKKIINQMLPTEYLRDKLHHMHYIKYFSNGHQLKHNHPKEKFSFILYLNDADGNTVLLEPINKSITPQQGKMIIFAGHIHHYAEKSYKQKEILVGGVDKFK